jgi:phage FluMu gp28-like protein
MNAALDLLKPDFESDVPAVLLPYQQAWIADKSPLKIAEKSRRIGLTWAEAADAALEAASDRSAGGQTTYYLGYNKDMTVEFIGACAMWARAYGLAAAEVEEGIWEDGDKHIQTYIIRFPKSGFRIEALTSRPSNLRGRQGRVILDEAAFHDDLEELLKSALALLIWGGCVRVISTHDGEDNPFNELIKEIRAGKRKGSVHRTTFKEAVLQGLYRRVCLRKGIAYDSDEETAWVQEIYDFYSDAASEELDVVASKGGGKWLTQSLLEQRQDKSVPVIRFTSPPHWEDFESTSEESRNVEVEDYFNEHLKPVLEAISPKCHSYYGLDFARKKNACSFWPLVEQQNTKKKCPFLFEMFKVPYKQQEKFLQLIVAMLPNFRKGAHDAGGNGGYLAEAMQVLYGARIEAIMLTEGWYREHTPHFKAALEDGDIENMPADRDVQEDHRAFVLVKGVARIPEQGKTNSNNKDRHGDSGIAHLLADYASKNPEAPIEWMPAPTREELESDQWDDWESNRQGAW